MTTPTDAQLDALWSDACKRDQPTRDMVRAFARAAIAAAQPVPDAPELDSHGRYWVQHRGAIIDAITRAGFHLMSDADGFWLSALNPTAAAHPQQPAPWQRNELAPELRGIVPAPTTDQSHPQR